jgi:MFS transporter, OFA family, oxalate/formate antiporter
MSVAAPLSHGQGGRLWAALLAATLLNLPLGSVYSFSVLLRPLEQELGLSRSSLSLVFGVATAGFTAGSVAAAFLYRLAPAPILVFASALLSAGGAALAATAQGLPQLLLGYGVVFGTGGGAAYILCQQGVNMLVQRRRGLVNGYIVSLYPMGAMIATPAFHACNEAFGWRTTLAGLAAVLLSCGAAAALLARYSGVRLAVPAGAGRAPERPATLGLTFLKLSATFFLAASAGLMVLSQAREIVASYGGAPDRDLPAGAGKTRKKPVYWIRWSTADLSAFPQPVNEVMGFALHQAQVGGKHEAAKPLKGFGGGGVLEIVEDQDGDAYRGVHKRESQVS